MHETYHKIQTLFLRDPDTNYKSLLKWQWAKPEFAALEKALWLFREKVDGMNIRVSLRPELFPYPKVTEVSVAGKTDKAELKQDLVQWIRDRVTPELWNEQFADTPYPTDITLYGEGYGAGIQKGGVYCKEKRFVLFDVRVGDLWLEQNSIEDIAKKFNIPFAPIVGMGDTEELVELVKGGMTSTLANTDGIPAEGIVAVPCGGLLNRFGERIITKLKKKDFPDE